MRSVCVLPFPRVFRPEDFDSGLNPDYLTDCFLERVRLVVEEVARLDMNYWLGTLLWPPWEIDIPSHCFETELLIEVLVANTLANAMTSASAQSLRESIEGPGWRPFYDKIHVPFELESRGGGLFGPVVLRGFKPG